MAIPYEHPDGRDNRRQSPGKEVNLRGSDRIERDSYTGEPLPPGTAGDDPIDSLEEDSFSDQTDYIPLETDTAMDFLLIDAAADGEPFMDQIDDFTEDADVLEDFSDRQKFTGGSMGLFEELLDHNSLGPKLSGGDIDAAWQSSDVSGEESVGGTVSTPDQDIVDDLGEAAGVTYDDDEELRTGDIIEERDANRWELDPRSAQDYDGDLDWNDETDEDNKELDDF
jgi:hypothetical protein